MSANKAIVGGVMLACAALGSESMAADAATAKPVTPVQMVDALNGVFGKQEQNRAIHAKGIVLEGSFRADAAAVEISKAAHLKAGSVPITVRFSDFAGIPTIADTDGLASPRGMAIKFHLNGADTDIVSHSVNAFPSPTTSDFRDLMLAIGASPPGSPSPSQAETYLGSHPIAKAFFDHLTPPPVSYATIAYFGVNAFEFTNSSGKRQFGRYQIIPAAGVHLLSADEVKAAGPNYLGDELRKRLHSGPATFTLQVQLAQAGDAIENPSVSWPDSRRIVKLGVITINRVVPDSEAAQRALMFSPSAVIDGITPADPMVADRNAAYGVSFGRRHAAD
jgi:catalase